MRIALRAAGKVRWAPLFAFAWVLLNGVSKRLEGTNDLNYSLQVIRLLPFFAFTLPMLSMTEAVDSKGGEISFVYHNERNYWMVRNAMLSILYAFFATLVATAGLQWAYHEIDARYLSVVFVTSWFYGWLGFCAMIWTKDAIWTALICLSVLFVGAYGTFAVLERVNVHDIFWIDESAFPTEILMRIGKLSGVLMIGSWVKLKYRS